MSVSDPRVHTMRKNLGLISDIISGKSWYDFGCGFGTSSQMLFELGASDVFGYEPNRDRVKKCPADLKVTAQDTIDAFDNVLVYGVLEHVYPEQRRELLYSLWSRLAPGGYMVIADTPNRLLPYDPHTTHLPFIPWLPERVSHYIAELSKRRWVGDWRQCGWRGLWLGDFSHLPKRIQRSPLSRRRHEILTRFGLHPHLIDPWPVWVWQKDPILPAEDPAIFA